MKRRDPKLIRRAASAPMRAVRRGPAHAGGPRLSARSQLVVGARAEVLRQVRGSVSQQQRPTVDLVVPPALNEFVPGLAYPREAIVPENFLLRAGCSSPLSFQ